MTLRERIAKAQPCLSVSGDDRCTRTDPHGPEDRHQRGAHSWGSRVPPQPRWLANLKAREMSGYGPAL